MKHWKGHLGIELGKNSICIGEGEVEDGECENGGDKEDSCSGMGGGQPLIHGLQSL